MDALLYIHALASGVFIQLQYAEIDWPLAGLFPTADMSGPVIATSMAQAQVALCGITSHVYRLILPEGFRTKCAVQPGYPVPLSVKRQPNCRRGSMRSRSY